MHILRSLETNIQSCANDEQILPSSRILKTEQLSLKSWPKIMHMHHHTLTLRKWNEFLLKTQIFQSVHLRNLMEDTLDISYLAIWSNRIHSLKYLRSTTLGCKDIGIRKSELHRLNSYTGYTPPPLPIFQVLNFRSEKKLRRKKTRKRILDITYHHIWF